MKDITEEIEQAGFEKVEGLCNTYTAIIPEKKLRVFITLSKNGITYSGSFQKTFKKPKNITELLKTVREEEIRAPNDNYDLPYDEKMHTKDGTVYTFFGGKVYIVDKGNRTAIIIDDGKTIKRTFDSPADAFFVYLTSSDNPETVIKELKKLINLL